MPPRTAIVTGSTSGIGEGIARAVAASGCNIVLNGFGDPAAIEKIRASIEAGSKVKCVYSPADMTKPDQIEAMFALAREALGPVDILVNNAGVQHVSPVEDFPVEKWNLIINLNLNAAFHTTRLAFPEMKARKWGRIINIASAHALVASPFKSAYVAAKHGILGFTKATALEGATFGIRVNAICPGYVKTPLVEGQIADQAKARGIAPSSSPAKPPTRSTAPPCRSTAAGSRSSYSAATAVAACCAFLRLSRAFSLPLIHARTGSS
jgi:3-hydroxybutyrate dehydrogenase